MTLTKRQVEFKSCDTKDEDDDGKLKIGDRDRPNFHFLLLLKLKIGDRPNFHLLLGKLFVSRFTRSGVTHYTS